MKITTVRATCDEGHVSDIETVVDCSLSLAAAALQSMVCPECGSRRLYMGGNHGDNPTIADPMLDRVRWWQERGEHGTSSLTLFAVFTGSSCSPHGRFEWPHDPSDFRRCKQLLDLIPEWRANLSLVVERFPWMKPFIDRWEEFERLYAVEAPSGMAPKLWQSMQEAAAEAARLRSVR